MKDKDNTPAFLGPITGAAENLFFAGRWLLVPLYLALVIMLLFLSVKVFDELIMTYINFAEISKRELIVRALSLIDIILIANLMVMVAFVSYENYVGPLQGKARDGSLKWMIDLDAGIVKIKLIMSIAAIAAIYLLEVFINIENYDERQIMWLCIAQLVFVISAVLLAYVDRLSHGRYTRKESL